jgi:hypothetical protein
MGSKAQWTEIRDKLIKLCNRHVKESAGVAACAWTVDVKSVEK